MKNKDSMNTKTHDHSKGWITRFYLLGPCITTIFCWFLGSLYISNKIIWIILFLLNAFIGILITLILIKNKRAYQFFLTRSIWILCLNSSLIYLCFLGLSYWLISKTTLIISLLIITSLIGWVVSFFIAKNGFNQNIDINYKNGVIDLESAQWDIQNQEVFSSKDRDKSRVDKILVLTRILISLIPPIVALIMRNYPSNQKLSLMTVMFSTAAIILFSVSGLSAGLSQSIRELETRIDKKVMIKTLE